MKQKTFTTILFLTLFVLTGCLNSLNSNDKLVLDEALKNNYNVENDLEKYKKEQNNSIFKLQKDKATSYMVINHENNDVRKINQIHIVEMFNNDASDIEKGTKVKKSTQLGENAKSRYKKLKSINFDYKIAKNKYYIFIEFDRDIFKDENVPKEDYNNILLDEIITSNYEQIEKVLLSQGFNKI